MLSPKGNCQATNSWRRFSSSIDSACAASRSISGSVGTGSRLCSSRLLSCPRLRDLLLSKPRYVEEDLVIVMIVRIVIVEHVVGGIPQPGPLIKDLQLQLQTLDFLVGQVAELNC